jgi:hypothetical protein
VYRRNQQQQQKPQQQQQPIVPWPVPLPGSSWKDESSLLSPVASAFHLDTQDHPEDWQIGFDLSGKPLKGSVWRTSSYRSCFDLVEHVDHVHGSPGVRPSPVGNNQMTMIFQSENSVPERTESNSGKLRKGSNSPATMSKNNNKNPHNKSQSKSKVNVGSENVKSVSKNSLGRAATSSNSWKSSSDSGSNNKRNNNKINHHSSGTNGGSSRNREGVLSGGRARKPKSEIKPKVMKSTTETELLAPVEFWKTDDKYNNDHDIIAAPASANVDFDSYLAETEQLLAHPEQVIGHSPDVSSSSSSTSSPAQRSAFIHLDTGGWEEVVYNKSGDSTLTAPILHQKEDLVIIDDHDKWQTQMKWSDNVGEE